MNDFVPYEPDLPAGARPLPLDEEGLVIRPALPTDLARVAQLLALRGHTAEEALEQAVRTIENVPVLLLALVDEGGQADAPGSDAPQEPAVSPPGDETQDRRGTSSPLAAAPPPGDETHPGTPPCGHAAAALPPRDASGGTASTTSSGGVALPPGDEVLAPAALAGAFRLPATALGAGAEEGESDLVWMVSGLVVDPDLRRRGVGRRLLAAVLGTVEVLEPGATIYSVVNASNHASVALHMTLGFTESARGPEFAGITFEGGQGVLLERRAA